LEFDHDRQTSFPLLGLHHDVTCRSCHANLVFSKAPTQCSQCHADLHRRQFGPDCDSCHTVRGWNVAISAIQKHSNRFPLIGAHAVATCDDCHHGAAAGVYTGLSTQCVSCHLKDYQTAKPLNHAAANLPVTCETCHSINVWFGAKFNHTQFTTFALTGAHAGLECVQCHTGGFSASLPMQCSGCHLADYNRTTNPNHLTGKFSTTCDSCHTTASWQDATFDHNLSSFPLTGAHLTVACAQCHLSGDYVNRPTQCVGCHLADFQKTSTPNHSAVGFSQDCTTCHTTTNWTSATFNHATTGFALAGAHATQACATCHVNNNYSLTSAACINCHLNDFNGATDPPHKAGGFPQDCTLCHGALAVDWASATAFNHATTGFALTGAHTSVQCGQCHANNNYSLTSGACWNCHQTDYNNTTNPSHKAANFAQDCSTCHTTVNWDGATFNHASTGFALVGLHASQTCISCHLNNNFNLTSAVCINCHLNDYNGANNPPHKAAGFPQDCTLCHGSSALNWTSAVFDHSTTGFTLTGAHISQQCAQCHVNNNYSLTSGACWNCHQTDYNGANNPPHKAVNFSQDCATCHTTVNWDGATFNHATTGFTLVGLHATQQCSACHTNNNYNLTSGACINCHLSDYNGAMDPPHKAAGFPQDCTLCHGASAVNWTTATFNHSTTGFTLTGAHTTVQCAQCHVNNNYSLTSGACWNCHQTDYNNTNNPPHKAGNFPQDCSGCHTTVNWDGATFNHATTGFALVGLHSSAQCVACHVNNNYTLTSAACWNCHQADYNGANSPPHKAGGFPQDCVPCHGASASSWTTGTFDHSTTGFPLVGLHATQQCVTCHVNNNYNLTSAACINCHLNDYNGANNPPHKAAGFPQDCTLCHGSSASNWTSATFNHATTGFTLTGAHTNLQCATCHTNNNYSLTSAACINCHLADYNGTNNPPHKSANFPQDCSGCHSTTDWSGAVFNHAATGFTLVGLHATQQCTACHVNGNYNLTSTACINCHLNDYNGANNPPHKAAGFPQDCTLCHGSSALNWTSATFNHATTGFTLTGAHTSLQCATCHTSNNYSLTSAACINCHLADYNGTNNPPHKTANFPQDCSGCHTTTDWSGATFNHATTGFALVGLHATQQCTACHVNGNYNLTSAACINCHLNDYNGANNPPHKAAGFPQDCTVCHGSSAANWTSATFNHASTGFTLTGAHTSLQCAQCHVNNNYGLTSAACVNCHLADYNGTTNPSHKSANFPQDCSGCHTTTDWSGATFNHATTGFTLAGLHATQQCTACHLNNNYNLTSAACINCHLNDYNGANNPPHQAAGFPQDCTLCHGSSAANWTSATFNHASTGFTLTGAHTSLQCAQCHTNSNYGLTSAACWNCHQSDYNGTTNPSHKAANFPQDCSGCHTTTDWTGATFNHATTGFTLVGLHATQQCNACHVNNNYSLTSAACINCHLNDYNGANNPPHKAAGFPQDCTLCHGSTATNWTSATFNHSTTGFTLTGAHTSLQCAQCHVNNNYSLTSAACWNCHQADYNGTTNPAHKAAGFPQDCSGCHTTTDWTGATFNHASTGFTLTGAHTSLQCSQCHVNNNFSLTSAACWNCHQTDYNGTTNPPHQSAGFPQDCSVCHSTTNWSGATFTHPTTPLQLTGFHATMLTNNQCAQCHVGNNYTNTPSDCWSCHQTDYNGTTNPGHAAAGFAQTCNTCHTFVDWTGAKYTAHDSAYFPIYSGNHNGKWTTCGDCHTNSSNYAVFTCIACHQHSNQQQVTSDHNGVKNFVYSPTSCYTCHPKGSGG